MPEFLYGSGDGKILKKSANFDAKARGTLHVDNVDVFYSLFEIPMQDALTLIPSALHPSIPAVLGVTFWRAKDSDIGPFILAFAAISCRTGIKPRHLVLQAYADSAQAQDFFSNQYAFSCDIADIYFQESYDRFYGKVTCGDQIVLESETTQASPLVGGGVAVKYSPPLNATSIDDRDVLVQFEAAYDFKRAARGTPRLNRFVGPVQPTTPISGTHAICDIDFMPARFSVDVLVPAEAGGAKKLQA
ncbi:MAG: hypothetical protein ACU84Q_07170 [Gammaproteobacteria bacterium]